LRAGAPVSCDTARPMTERAATPSPLALAFAGLVALAVAMGIGRFAFTPLLPLMLAEHAVDLAGASLLASANYFGYLVGALACTFQPWIARRIGRSGTIDGPRWVRGGLVATAVLTLGMAWHVPLLWPWLRFAAGVASAVVFLYTSGWCLEQLARRGVPAMGALIYVGPGGGIVASGLAASVLVARGSAAEAGWFTFAVLAALLSATVWRVFDTRPGVVAAPVGVASGAGTEQSTGMGPAGISALAFAYGLAGIGYIVTATFLPVIARQALPGSPWLDLFWPLFGVGVMLGAILASRMSAGGDLRLRLAGCYAVQAVGVAASLVSPTLAGFGLGSFLLGLPFTAITFFAMQEVRRVRPLHATPYMGLLTALYGLGQIAGPPLATALVARSASPAQGFTVSLWIASALLVVGALIYVVLARQVPLRRR
jgi:MFS family permease